MFNILIGIVFISSPVILLSALLLFFYLVFIKKKRTVLYTALLFLSIGILINPELYRRETPSKVEHRYNKAVKAFNQIIGQDNPGNKKQRMYSELNSLRLDSGHAYIDYVKLIELQEMIDNKDYKTMLSNLDKSYNINMEMLKNEYNNRWKRYMELVFFIGFLAAITVFVISFVLISRADSEKKEPEAG